MFVFRGFIPLSSSIRRDTSVGRTCQGSFVCEWFSWSWLSWLQWIKKRSSWSTRISDGNFELHLVGNLDYHHTPLSSLLPKNSHRRIPIITHLKQVLLHPPTLALNSFIAHQNFMIHRKKNKKKQKQKQKQKTEKSNPDQGQSTHHFIKGSASHNLPSTWEAPSAACLFVYQRKLQRPSCLASQHAHGTIKNNCLSWPHLSRFLSNRLMPIG